MTGGAPCRLVWGGAPCLLPGERAMTHRPAGGETRGGSPGGRGVPGGVDKLGERPFKYQRRALGDAPLYRPLKNAGKNAVLEGIK